MYPLFKCFNSNIVMLLFTDEVQIKFSPVLIGGTMHQTSVFSIRKHCELKNVCVHLEIESIKLRTWDNTVRHCVAASKVMLLYTDEVWINLLPVLIVIYNHIIALDYIINLHLNTSLSFHISLRIYWWIAKVWFEYQICSISISLFILHN